MKQLDGDHDQRLLGRFALGLLAEINGAPLATTAHGIDGGEVERMARNTRADGRQARRRRAVAALVDDRVKADIRDERPRIGEAGERAEFAEQGGGRLRADARDGLQQLGVGGPSAGLAGGQQRRGGAVDLVNRAGETLELSWTAFSAMKDARAGALIVESSSMLFTSRTRLADLALKNRLPTMFAQREYAEAGGLMAYSADFLDLFRRTATFVDKILKGAKPADLPVEQPTKWEFVINLKTAKALGLTIPPTLFQRADHVIDER